ncbi:glycosyltransferase family 1 protein [Micromonospora rubida]|uniref:Glycosyltransferase family 1 protein n=1 Tax=Micromonospora rubida TaxID=2697657 RepID=A0ABW7SRL8_9ACTN
MSVARRAVRRSAERALRLTTSPRAMRSGVLTGLWNVALGAPALPDATRVRLAEAVHAGLVGAGRPDRAAHASAVAMARLHDAKLRATVLARRAGKELDAGTPPSLAAAVAAELALADASFARGDVPGAVASVQAAQRRVFDRRLHFDRLTSPLAEDPAAFLAPWHASTAVRALSAPRGRCAPVAPAPVDRPLRLLMVTYGNHGFLDLVRRHFDQRPDVELRFLDPGETGTHVPLLGNSRAMMEHLLAGHSEYGDTVAEWLAPQVEWADVVFVDWCAALAVLFSLIDPGTTRVVVRLHSFEAFAMWPHLVDFTRVDDLIFVSDHLRDLTVAAVPALAAAGTRRHVISNAMDLPAFQRPKSADARFTLGLVGIKAVAKDPRWAVEVLRELRVHDERYRLLLFGKDLDPGASPDSRRYWDAFLADIAELEPSGAVVRRGQVDDVPGALTEVGVILSSSVRESFHCGLVEGAASGAVPVVRDWPFFAGKPASARTLFPADWVVDTPAEAAQRILAATATEDAWRKAGEEAAEHAVETWGWQRVKHQFDEVVTGRS